MTPAERLLAAADLLDKRAGEAAPGPWPVTSDNHLALATVEMPYMIGPARGTDRRFPVNFPDDATAYYIATMHPGGGQGAGGSPQVHRKRSSPHMRGT